MTETEFIEQASAVLSRLEAVLDAAADAGELDCDLERKGTGILEIEFENASKIIVNLQTPMQEIWLAARAGGFHFRHIDGAWRDTRHGTELIAALQTYIAQQSGVTLNLSA